MTNDRIEELGKIINPENSPKTQLTPILNNDVDDKTNKILDNDNKTVEHVDVQPVFGYTLELDPQSSKLTELQNAGFGVVYPAELSAGALAFALSGKGIQGIEEYYNAKNIAFVYDLKDDAVHYKSIVKYIIQHFIYLEEKYFPTKEGKYKTVTSIFKNLEEGSKDLLSDYLSDFNWEVITDVEGEVRIGKNGMYTKITPKTNVPRNKSGIELIM